MREIVGRFKAYIVYLFILSFVINILMLTPAFYMLTVIDKVMASRSNTTLFVVLAIALYALVIMGVLYNIMSRLFNQLGAAFKKEVAPRVLELSLRGIHQPELIQHGLDDVNVFEGFLTGSGIKGLFELPWIPIFVFILYWFHPALALVAVMALVILFALALLEDRLTTPHEKRATELSRRASSFAFVARQNAETVSALGMQSAIKDRWSRLTDDSLQHGYRANRTSALIQSIAKFVRVGTLITGMTVGVYLIINSNVTAGIMIASILIMNRALKPIGMVIESWKSFVGARSAYTRLDKLLDGAAASEVPTIRLPRPTGELSVEHLYFQVSVRQRILNDIHFKLAPGESLGIIGPSGSGKTTLARMMVGLLKPTHGHVRLDGADVSLWAEGDLGQYVGYLPQDVMLFPGTVAENIARMQDPEGNTDAIIKAAKMAGAHAMILRLPEGYGTQVGEGGARLSGGQRQLVGLARALFGEPSLVVLDEPNSNLDSAAEASLVEVIRDLVAHKVTVAVITHKPSVVRDVDRLLVLRGGEQNLFGRNQEVLRLLNASPPSLPPSEPSSAEEPEKAPKDQQPDAKEAR